MARRSRAGQTQAAVTAPRHVAAPRVAVALTLVPAAPAIRGSKENEPLGAWVVRVARAATAPLRRRVTCQVAPARFWSTSNSVSRRPSSGLTLSFQVLPSLQRPERWTTFLSPPPRATAEDAGAATKAAAARRAEMRWLVMTGSRPGSGLGAGKARARIRSVGAAGELLGDALLEAGVEHEQHLVAPG